MKIIREKQSNSLSVSINVLYAKNIYPADASKHNSNCEKQVILLMIPNREGWRYLALFRGITSKHHGDFYCINCLHLLATENKCKSHKKVCENKDFCDFVMPSEDTKILEFNQNQKYEKVPCIIYANVQCLIEKIDECKNVPENSSRKK